MPSSQQPKEVDFTELGIERDEFNLVKSALADSDYSFRTIPGIENETGLPPETIEVILNRAGMARESVLKDDEGNQCYAPAEQRKSLKEHFEIVRYVLTN